MTFKAYSIQTELGGQTYNASYLIEAGSVCVMSAYGSKSAPLGRKNPKTLATQLLAEIVQGRDAAKAASSRPR